MACAAGGLPPAWNETDRLAALRSYAILDTEPEAVFDVIARLAVQFCQAPIALVSFVDERRQWMKAVFGTGMREAPLEMSICRTAIREGGLFVVPDLSLDARFRDNPLVTGEPHLRFYAGAPLAGETGLPIGMVCVLDPEARPGGLTREQGEALTAFARAVMDQLDLRRTGRALQDSERRLEAIADAMPHIVWSALPDGHHDHYNARWYEFTGLPPGSKGTASWNGVCHPQDRDRAWQEWRHSLETGQDYQSEYRLRHRSGEYRRMLARAAPVRDRGGEIERWFGTAVDTDANSKPDAALAECGARFRTLAGVAASVVWHASSDGAVTGGCTWDSLTGQPIEEARGTGWLERLHPEDRQAALLAWNECVRSGRDHHRATFRVRHVGGDYRWVEAHAAPVRSEDGCIREWVGTVVDIEERRRSELSRQASEERLRLALAAGGMFAWEVDLAALTLQLSFPAETGASVRSVEEALGGIDPRDRAGVRQAAEAALRGEGAGAFAVQFRTGGASGAEPRWLSATGRVLDGAGAARRLVGVCSDITAQKAAEVRLWHMANHDGLTGLPNRTRFQERLDEAIGRGGKERLAVMLVDLDGFGDVNDTLGYEAGDALLRMAAARLEAIVRQGEFVARLGGDEFALVTRISSGEADAEASAERVLRELSRPYRIEGKTLICRASIGVALHPDHAGRAADLVRHADVALHRAKTKSRNGAVLYRPGLGRAAEQRVTLEAEIRAGLEQRQFVPFYQPIVCLATGRVAGFEALARWRHPARGLLSPGAFAPALEDSELAAALGERMLGRVVEDVRSWLGRGIDCGTVALNVSAAEFRDAGFADRVLSRLASAGIAENRLKIEVTETVFLGAGSQEVDRALRRFDAAGVRIALDDFGTGYASLTHLKRFPIDQIKIDRSFIRSIENDAGDGEIVSAVIRMGEGLRMETVAEGIETLGQLRLLQDKRCGFGQGYLFAKPMPAGRLPRFLDEWRLRRSTLVAGAPPPDQPPPRGNPPSHMS